MNRFKLLACIGLLLTTTVGLLVVRDYYDRINTRELFSLVRSLGGRSGSITPPIPFCGSEIAISFYDVKFSEGDLGQLAVSLARCERHYVSFYFENTNVTAGEVDAIRTSISYCLVTIEEPDSE